MYIGKPESKTYAARLEFTRNELKDLQYILSNFTAQLKLTNNTHYDGDKLKVMEKIMEIQV